jgi:hypothetical protein
MPDPRSGCATGESSEDTKPAVLVARVDLNLLPRRNLAHRFPKPGVACPYFESIITPSLRQ